MLRSIIIWAGIALTGYGSLCAAQSQSENRSGPDFRSTLNTYCVVCHSDVARVAGLSLEKIDVNSVGPGSEIWEKVLRKLRARTMPPAGMSRPDEATYQAFADYLETGLDNYAKNYPNPGRTALRRLNRTEYANAVRDLLAVEVKGEELFADDDTMFGFDNIGDVLTLSPVLTEQYLSAARKIRRMAIPDADMQPVFDYYTILPYHMQEDRVSDELPLGSRGGIAIHHHFPLDGEYVLQASLQRNSREYIRGLTEPHQLDVRVDGVRIKQFTIGGENHGRSAGIFSTGSSGDVEQEHYERTADRALEVRFPAKAGTRLVTVAFMKQTTIPEEPLYPLHTLYDYAQYKGGLPAIHTVGIGGPFDAQGLSVTASREKIFICQPANSNNEQCAREIISSLAHRAYRRSPSSEELQDLFGFYRQGQANGGFETGIGMAIERILAGPEFLFLTGLDPENIAADEVYSISDTELATRLSFFLWSSIPDEELLELAESGRLKDPQVLQQQLERMLADPRSQSLVSNFASQWLNLRRLSAVAPDGELFPYFDDDLRLAFQKETELFFEYVLREDRPLMELLDADYTFVNDLLARHYGIPDVYGGHFRKVSLQDGTRGGLLGQGSILTVTSYANRTSPVIRGKWILENILGSPPPPPPANVPGLRERNDAGKVLSMRAQMEQHRANPVCATCHKVMDPLGFALENYDAIGKWRTIDTASKSPIDSSGALPDGTTFEGPSGLREVLLQKRQDDFVATVVEKLLTYALGRGVEHTDIPVIRSIMRQTADDDYRLSALIKAIIQSTPFQMRRASSHADI